MPASKVTYVAIDNRGQEVRGEVEAADTAQAASLLRGRGLFPVDLTAGGTSAAAPSHTPRRAIFPSVLRTSDVVLWCTQLALMLRTGLSLLQSLESLADRSERRLLRESSSRLAERVRAGGSLSAALTEERRLPEIVAHLVRTAEVTGELDQAFDRAAVYLDQRATLRYQLMTSLTYPSLVILVSAGVFWFLTTSVVPKFARFLSSRQVALPWTTQRLMELSAFLQTYGVAVLGCLAALAIGLLVAYRTERGRLAIDKNALRVPGLGLILKTAAMGHLSRTLGMLVKSGLPLLSALRVLSETFQNRGYRESIGHAADAVVRGTDLSTSLDQPGITPLTRQLVGVGEEAGELDSALDELATHYERRLQRVLQTVAGLVEPAILLVVGGMVGFVYLSFFQAVFQLASR